MWRTCERERRKRGDEFSFFAKICWSRNRQTKKPKISFPAFSSLFRNALKTKSRKSNEIETRLPMSSHENTKICPQTPFISLWFSLGDAFLNRVVFINKHTHTHTHTTSNTPNTYISKMAFSVVASSSLLSSRVSTPLKKQNKRNSRNSHAFSCKAMSDAEIDAKYPVGGSVYKVKSFWTFPSVFPLSCSVVTIHHRQNQCLLLILAMKEKKKKLFAFSNWSFFLPYADDEAEIRENLFSPLCFLFIQK